MQRRKGLFTLYLLLTKDSAYRSYMDMHWNSENEEAETFYQDLVRPRRREETEFVIVTGDFNTKIGTKELENKQYVGHFGLSNRTERGKMLYHNLNNEHLFYLNTFFDKLRQRKRAWTSPDKTTKNELQTINFHLYNTCFVYFIAFNFWQMLSNQSRHITSYCCWSNKTSKKKFTCTPIAK